MRIVGNGFVARHLRDTFGERFPGVTAFAAGVSSTSVAAAGEFDREAELLYATLRECRERGHTLLFFSTASFAMYGMPDSPARESGPLFPPSVYGRHKLALESSVRSSGAGFLVLRLSHLVGTHQRAHQLVPAIVGQVRSGTVTVYEGAHRDLLDVRDLMRVIERLLAEGVRGEVLNVASGTPEPVTRIVEQVERRMETVAERRTVANPGGVSRTAVSVDRLCGFIPEYGTEWIGDGYLERMLDAYVPHYAADASCVAGR